jgi:multidrug efflux pump subunit AcrA (membrane-fusion protein)
MGGLGVAVGLIAIVALLWKRLAEWGRTVSLAVRARRPALLTLRRRFAAAAAVLVLLLLVIPWTLTSPGTLVVRPVATLVVSAADSGVIAQVFVTEGMRVAAGAPLVRVVDRALERELLATGRAVDSLTISETAARSAGMSGVASRLAAERESALAALAALERRVGDLTLRAASSGTVATPRPEELIGRRVAPGDSLLALAALDSVELRIALAGAGATRVRAGQIVHAISFADLSQPFTARVADVSTIGITGAGAGGVIEARVRRAARDAWRAGTIGEASVELERSNMLGALWWKTRQLLRTDLWL